MTTKPIMVHGVKLGAVKIPLVDAALARRGLPIGGTDQQKVARLAQWYGQYTPKNKIADCSTCGGESDVSEPACPFCGDGETEADESTRPPSGTSGKVATEAAPKVKPKPAVQPSPPPVAAAVVEPPAPPVLVRYQRATIAREASEEALDAAVREIGELMQAAADRLWELGSVVKDVFDQSLWTQRKAEDGRAKYKAWGQFCEAELGISHGYSLKLMDVVKAFTREQVRTIGASKLYITLQVPKEARERMLGAAEQGSSKRELEKLAEDIGKEKRQTGRKGKGGAGTHRPGGSKGGRKPEKITVAMLTTRIELHPTTQAGKRVKLKMPGPLACEERLFNGVKQRIVITNDDDGSLIVIVERARE